jgi:hypothetical protein
MPSLKNLARLQQLASLPETRRLVISTVRAGHLQNAARRAVHDRAGLIREVREQRLSRERLRSTVEHPATRELANAGLLFLPIRYLPVGWLVGRVARRALRPRQPR